MYRIFYFGGYGPAPHPDRVEASNGYFMFNTGSEEQFTVSKSTEQFGLILKGLIMTQDFISAFLLPIC